MTDYLVPYQKYKKLVVLGEAMRKLLEDDYTKCLIIDGEKGKGKSSLGNCLGELISKGDFKLERNIVYDCKFEAIKKSFAEASRYTAIMIDEADRGMSKYEVFDPVQQALNYFMNRCRKKQNKCFILCTPFFRQLAPTFRNDHVNYWIHVLRRGRAIVIKKSANFMSKDPWNIKVNEEIVEKYAMSGENELERNEDLLAGMKGFWDFIDFPEYHAYARYEELALQLSKNIEVRQGTSKMLEKWRTAAISVFHVLHDKYGLSNPEIARGTGLDQRTIWLILEKGKIEPGEQS